MDEHRDAPIGDGDRLVDAEELLDAERYKGVLARVGNLGLPAIRQIDTFRTKSIQKLLLLIIQPVPYHGSDFPLLNVLVANCPIANLGDHSATINLVDGGNTHFRTPRGEVVYPLNPLLHPMIPAL